MARKVKTKKIAPEVNLLWARPLTPRKQLNALNSLLWEASHFAIPATMF